MGVLVTNASGMSGNAPNSRNRSTSSSIGRSSGETMKSMLPGVGSAPKRPPRPVLPALTTSISTPHLRSVPIMSSPASSSSGSSLTSRTTADTARASGKQTATPVSDQFYSRARCEESPLDASQPASRWSMDSVASRPSAASFHPMRDTPATVPGTPQTPTSGRKRDRLISFITRGRSGSLGKGLPPIPNPANAGQDNMAPLPRSSVSREPSFVILSPRPSLSAPAAPSMPSYAPATSPPTATMLSTSSSDSSTISSASSLQTPVSLEMHRHAPHSKHADLYTPDSPAFAPEAYAAPIARSGALQGASASAGGALLPPFEYHEDAYQYDHPPTPPTSPPPEPTLPLPSPGTPTASFLVSPQQRSQSFFASLPFKKGSKRRDKKLVITGVPLEDADDGRETDWKSTEKRRRYANVVRWCEAFGEVRKIERKPDGTLHVYWRDWESADMVRHSCRFS